MTSSHPILIVGGGIAGLATALALSQTGRASLIIEQAEAFAEIGAGIQIGPNGSRMLDRLGLLDWVRRSIVTPDDLIVMDGVSAQEVTRIPTGAGFVRRFGYPYALVHRADLHSALLQACRADPNVELRSGAALQDFVEQSGAIHATTTCGVIACAALIGADGLWSRVRQTIVGDGAPRVSGHIAYRAVLPTEAIEPQFRRNAMILWAGPRNHLVQYPLRGGELFNLVAVFHSDRYVEGWDRQGDPAELHQRFAGNCDIVRALLAKVETWRMWVLCDREPVRRWNAGRAVLVGDAAHPMLQYLAQGAGMSLEDAVALADAVQARPNDLPSAFATFSAARYQRTARCQIMARLYGAFYHAEDVVRELANDFIAQRDGAATYESLAWLYDHDAGRIGDDA